MGCTHLARAEPLFSVFIIRRDTQFLICPLGRVGIRKVTQHSIWVVPEAPENPEPHGRTEELGLDHLGSGQLRELSVPGLNVRTSASPARRSVSVTSWGESVPGRRLSAPFAPADGVSLCGPGGALTKGQRCRRPWWSQGWACRTSALSSWSPLFRGHRNLTLTQLALCYQCWSRRCYPTRTRPSACSSRINYSSRPS